MSSLGMEDLVKIWNPRHTPGRLEPGLIEAGDEGRREQDEQVVVGPGGGREKEEGRVGALTAAQEVGAGRWEAKEYI